MVHDKDLFELLLYCLITYVLLLAQHCRFVHGEHHTAASAGVRLITASTFADDDSIEAVKQDAWYEGEGVGYDDNQDVWLNPDPRKSQTRAWSNIGKIVRKDQVRFRYGGHHPDVVSFKTSFIFQIFTTTAYPYRLCGSGMAFFIADNKKAPKGSYGRFLGLVDPNAPNSSRFFAVEFDTHQTQQFADPSSSHIGININSLESRTHLDSAQPPAYPELFLYNNYTFIAWIEYDAAECNIKVWMSNLTSAPRPPSPCLNLTYNLSHVFQDHMYVGFSATSNASNDSMEGLVLNAWNFTLYPPVSSQSKTKLIAIPLVVIVFTFFLVYTVLVHTSIPSKIKKLWGTMLTLHERNANIDTSYEQHMHHPALREYSYNELKLACGDFAIANEIGRGAFSIVYKATLLNGQTVAIKKLKKGCRIKDLFSTELKVISTLRHKNLLPLLGWCYQEDGAALLVYEYMSKGSLHHLLSKGTLSSEVRLEILAGVASALEYLHAHAYSSMCVVHRDVKAANVLLTDKFKAVLCDFGLARLIRPDDSAEATTAMGSPGYVAPEVLEHKKVTDKADVYSYGVLVLVVATGRPAVVWGPTSSTSMQPVYDTLVNWVKTKHELMEALDVRMCEGMADSGRIKWRQVLQMGLTCVTKSPQARPQMSEICKAFQEAGGFSWTRLPHDGLHIFSHSHDEKQGACMPPNWTYVDFSHVNSCNMEVALLRSIAIMPTTTFGPGEHWEGR